MEISNECAKSNIPKFTPKKMAYTTENSRMQSSKFENQQLFGAKLEDPVKPLRERKFFKRSRVNSPNFNKRSIKSSIETEDISKFFNISSRTYITPAPLEAPASKSLKTYTNPRIFKQCDKIIESFGLPDDPIVADNMNVCKVNGVLDTNCPEVSETTMLEMQNLEDSWIVKNYELGEIFSSSDDFRIKVDPQSNKRISQSFEALDKLFTSTPCTKMKESMQKYRKKQPENMGLENSPQVIKDRNGIVAKDLFKIGMSLSDSILYSTNRTNHLENNPSIKDSQDSRRSLRSSSKCNTPASPNVLKMTKVSQIDNTAENEIGKTKDSRELQIRITKFDTHKHCSEVECFGKESEMDLQPIEPSKFYANGLSGSNFTKAHINTELYVNERYSDNYIKNSNILDESVLEQKALAKTPTIIPITKEKKMVEADQEIMADNHSAILELNALDPGNTHQADALPKNHLTVERQLGIKNTINGQTTQENANLFTDSFKSKLKTKFEKISEGIFGNGGKLADENMDSEKKNSPKISNSSKSIEVSLQLLQILPYDKDQTSILIENVLAKSKPQEKNVHSTNPNNSEIKNEDCIKEKIVKLLKHEKNRYRLPNKSSEKVKSENIEQNKDISSNKVNTLLKQNFILFKDESKLDRNMLSDSVNYQKQSLDSITVANSALDESDMPQSALEKRKRGVRRKTIENSRHNERVKNKLKASSTITSSLQEASMTTVKTIKENFADCSAVNMDEFVVGNLKKDKNCKVGKQTESPKKEISGTEEIGQKEYTSKVNNVSNKNFNILDDALTIQKSELDRKKLNSLITSKIDLSLDNTAETSFISNQSDTFQPVFVKKRGRPRKYNKNASQEENIANNLQASDSINNSEGKSTIAITAVKVGLEDRATDILDIRESQDISKDNSKTKANSLTRKKLGRPKKIKNIGQQKLITGDFKTVSQTIENELVIGTATKGKLILNNLSTTGDSEAEKEELGMTSPKIRGRKKKQVDSIKYNPKKIDWTLNDSIEIGYSSEVEITFHEYESNKDEYNKRIRFPVGKNGIINQGIPEIESGILNSRVYSKSYNANCDLFSKSLDSHISDFNDVPLDKQKMRSRSSLGERRSRMFNRRASCSVITRTKEVIQEFTLGAIVWGQIGKNPFWPCLITKELLAKQFKKEEKIRNSKRVLYHVRFFGDKGRRAWISAHKLKTFSNRNDLENFYRHFFTDISKAELQFYKIRKVILERWTQAVNEAELLAPKPPKDRIKSFEELFDNISVGASSEKKKPETESDVEDHFPKINDREAGGSKCFENKSDRTAIISVKKESEPQSKKIMTRRRRYTEADIDFHAHKKAKREEPITSTPSTSHDHRSNRKVPSFKPGTHVFDEIVTEGVLSGESEPAPAINTESLETQRQLFKRNNLFRGVPKEKMCQYCFENGDVYKCTGQCNGLYHSNCASDLFNWSTQMYKYIKCSPGRKKKNDNKDELVQYKHENNSAIEVQSNNDQLLKSKQTFDERVQIITVPSSIFNTPPKRVFPPDFENMSLAEQIDYKMKEVMRKFESNTKYVYSQVDSSSDEKDISPKQDIYRLKKERNSRVNNGISNSMAMSHITADSLLEQEVTCLSRRPLIFSDNIPSIKPIIKNDLSVKPLNTLDNVEAECSNGSSYKKAVVQKINPKIFKCCFCVSKTDPFCFICHQEVSKKGSTDRQKCSLYWCGRFYHPECLKLWPQTQWSLLPATKQKNSKENVDSFVCPQHVCHTCASENPRAAMARCAWDKTVRCLLCPSAYHTKNFCIPAGSEILTTTQIICPRHRTSKLATINTTWCFLCSEGGNLICCETCPTSVHPECLPVHLTEDNKFICEDCESGRLPLYDEVVWVKLGKFRWWPGVILFPNEIPLNLLNLKHGVGDFVVKFFGTYDHYWVTRGRSFLFQEGDTNCSSNAKGKYDELFNKAVDEAIAAHKLKKEFKQCQEIESLSSQKPPHYIKIKVNKPVGNVRVFDMNLSNTTACECDPSQPDPCGPDSDCLNRILMTECTPEMCPAGKMCNNQSFEKRAYPPLIPYKTQGRGWGLKSLAPIPKGRFVLEYVGEVIDADEYQRRLHKMHEQKDENYYFLTIDKDRMIDAGPKGNLARFMNHCCQPNCETQKWTVNGDTRIGLFAMEDIPADTELTFNYNLECIGEEKKVCRCEAPNCSGFIGAKAKQNVDTDCKKPKKTYKKIKPPEPAISLPPCFVCKRSGKVVLCSNKICNKAYHLRCLKNTERPEGNKFICPWHNCNVCSKRTIRGCVKCTNSFCPSHSESNIRYDSVLGFVCCNHDRSNAAMNQTKRSRKGKNIKVVDNSPSTTTDEEETDTVPLINRIKKRKLIKSKIAESDVDDSNISLSTTPEQVNKLDLPDINDLNRAICSTPNKDSTL